jgi:Fe-S cluster assembly iron-binding protein IscA
LPCFRLKRKYKLKKITKKSHKSEEELRAGGCQGFETELDVIENEKKKKKKRKNMKQNHEML